jgi:hypothetical protein
MLTFTSVYFSESGLFNGLRPFGVKKFLFSRHPVSRSPRRSSTLQRSQAAEMQGDWKINSTDLGFSQDNVVGFHQPESFPAIANMATKATTRAGLKLCREENGSRPPLRR